MKGILKNISILVAGIILALLLLFLYSQIESPTEENVPQYIEPELDKVFIAAVSGEVYVLRNEETITVEVGFQLLEGDVLKVVDQSYCQLQFAKRGTASISSNTLLKLQSFFNAEKEQEFHTEVLMGSMLYRVNRSEEDQDFLIEAEGVLYEITGTEFLITRTGVGTRLSVTEGSVLVRSGEGYWDSRTARDGEEIYVPMGSEEPVMGPTISREQQEKRDELLGLAEIVVQAEQPVQISLETSPSGGEIYLQGRKIGHSNFQGFFHPGTQLQFRIRKRGYQDSLLEVKVEAGQHRLFKIILTPLSLEESLNQNQEEQQESPEEILRNQYEEILQQQQQNLSEVQNRLREQEQRNINQRETHNKELQEKEQEINRLKTLITQIQELAGS